MNKLEAVEYAVFHWVFGSGNNLPGLTSDGYLDYTFFKDGSHKEKRHCEEFSVYFEAIKLNPSLNSPLSLMLCSGGVDSSLLACFRQENQPDARQALLHSAYIDHANNDLYKFQNIVQKCPSISYVCSINSASYIEGIDFLSSRGFYQNTYGPTLATALHHIPPHKFNLLVTGSGPDELFYGMEKYSWDIFEKLEQVPIHVALKKLDPHYNSDTYTKLFNKDGNDMYREVLCKRSILYKNIADFGLDIFDSQRLLAYATVTSQHMQLFNTVADFFHMKHDAPYLNDSLVRAALNTPLRDLVDIGISKHVEIGKKFLKKFLSRYMDVNHTYGRKIGFHAPTSEYIHFYARDFLLENIDFFPSWLDKDLTLSEISQRYNGSAPSDYFLYSLINLVKHNKGQRHEDW